MEQFIHQNGRGRCPRCGFVRSWVLRRNARRCKRCRKEWVPVRRIPGFRAPLPEWKRVIRAFLYHRTGVRTAEALGTERHRVHRILHHLRGLMYRDSPQPFRGTVEMDETYVGGQWRNKPAHIRRLGTKRGHGTSKQAIFGIYHRGSKTVFVRFVPDLKRRTLVPIVQRQVRTGSTVYTDGYNVYKPLEQFYRREYVDHASGEYVRGTVHTNSIESFWGYLKRRLKITGGIRMSRLHLYVAEETWRFNHRRLSLDDQTEKLYRKLVDEL